MNNSPSNIVSEIAEKNISIFENSEFGKVRTVVINNEPYFVGKEIAEILGYANPNEAIAEHIEEEDKLNSKTLSSFELNLGQRGGWLVNESGLYSLILSSKLPSAKKFKHWVTSEVLPSIRKHGLYAEEELLNDPDLFIKVLQDLKQERLKRKEAEDTNAILMHTRKLYTITEIAKELGLRSGNELNQILYAKGIQYKVNETWIPTAEYSECGYFSIKQDVLENGHVIYDRKVTQLGRKFILELVGNDSLSKAEIRRLRDKVCCAISDEKTLSETADRWIETNI